MAPRDGARSSLRPSRPAPRPSQRPAACRRAPARCPRTHSETRFPRACSRLFTVAASSAARPSGASFRDASASLRSPSTRHSGSSSGPVPSPLAERPSHALQHPVGRGGRYRLGQRSVDSLAVQPGNAPLVRSDRYRPFTSRWIVTPAGRRSVAPAGGTTTHSSGKPHASYTRSFPGRTSVVWSTSSTTSGKSLSPMIRDFTGVAGARRVQVERLVRLHRPLGPAVGVPHQQGDRSVRDDRRAAHRGDSFRQMGQPPGGPFMNAVLVGDYPGGRGPGVPVLEPVVEVLELVARERNGLAAGEPERIVVQRRGSRGVRRRCARRSGCILAARGKRRGWSRPFLIVAPRARRFRLLSKLEKDDFPWRDVLGQLQCSGVRQSGVKSAGLATIAATQRAREVATLRRWRL